MTDLRKAAEIALDALMEINKLSIGENAVFLPAEIDIAMDALRQALAQPEQVLTARVVVTGEKQEPVAWLDSDGFPWSKEGVECRTTKDTYTPLYTAPPKREWVGLTDEGSKPLIQKAMMYYGHNPDHWTLTAGAGFCILARAIAAKLKEKNGG